MKQKKLNNTWQYLNNTIVDNTWTIQLNLINLRLRTTVLLLKEAGKNKERCGTGSNSQASSEQKFG